MDEKYFKTNEVLECYRRIIKNQAFNDKIYLEIIRKNLNNISHTQKGADIAYDLFVLGAGKFEDNKTIEEIRGYLGMHEDMIDENKNTIENDLKKVAELIEKY